MTMALATQRSVALSVSSQPLQSLCPAISNTPNLVSFSAIPPTLPIVYCGRGDRKTAKGKRFAHSFGNARPRDKKKGRGPPRVPMPPSPSKKKDRFDYDY